MSEELILITGTAEESMRKGISHLETELTKIRAGKKMCRQKNCRQKNFGELSVGEKTV